MDKIAYISSYSPRKCGIATYTKNLIVATNQLHLCGKPLILAMNEDETVYNYDSWVVRQIRKNFPEDYAQTADFVNSSKIELVHLQHEFGLFGGEWGKYINYFLEKIRKPVVSTLHTLSPSLDYKAQTILKQIAKHSSKIVVMTRNSIPILMAYDIPCSKIEIIQHGCPDVPFVDRNKVKPSVFGLKEKIVLSTFGLISRGKGIEYVIRALPEVLEKQPNIVYLVIGETHPNVRKSEGERYRRKLVKLVNDLDLHEHVQFLNRFLLEDEIIDYLQATDIYITPFLDPNQISSGTLVYAMGTGNAIIATPYLHAQEALAENRGLFCKFRDHRSIAECISQLLEDEKLRKNMQKEIYNYSRDFTWGTAATRYAGLYRRALNT
jgi:glycosyltransferase involved in cell wall biosynthesis